MKRLLYVAHRVPYPPDKGERVRAFHEIQSLSQHFRVTLAALAHNRSDVVAADGLQPWCEAIHVARAGGTMGLARGTMASLAGRSVTEGYFQSHWLQQRIQEEAREPFDLALAYCSGSLSYALAVGAKACVADLVDVDSAKWDAYAASAGPLKAWLYRREAEAVRRLERRALEACDAVVLVSRAEAAGLDVHGATADVLAIGNGVDTEYFRPAGSEPAGPPTLVFTGTMDYRPNVEGVCWFADKVWPSLRQIREDLRFVIVGRSPAPAIQRLARRPGVEVTGSVPDVRPYLASTTVAVVPLLTARGIQNKVLEAMAAGRAVVATPAAVEGLDVVPGRDLVQAETPGQWRDRVLDLLHRPGRRREVERAARQRIEEQFAWEAQLAPLVATCRRLAGCPAPSPALSDNAQSQAGEQPPGFAPETSA